MTSSSRSVFRMRWANNSKLPVAGLPAVTATRAAAAPGMVGGQHRGFRMRRRVFGIRAPLAGRPVLAGLIAVAGLLLVGGAPAAEPAAIAARAQTLITTNPLLDGYGIEVVAQRDGLRLQGTVANPDARELATALAELVAEGRTVETALETAGDLPEESGELRSQIDDLTTAARLRQRLRWQVSALGLDVRVEVDRGIVRLHGTVGTTSRKDSMAAVAARTRGVLEVFNYIGIEPARIADERERQQAAADARHSDTWIRTRLKALLAFDSAVHSRAIEVEVDQGQVLISGTVGSTAERSVVEAIAADVPGVEDLDSRLIIEHPL